MTPFLVHLAVAGLGLAPAPKDRFVCLDLQPYANRKLTDTHGRQINGNNLSSLPVGEQTFEGVRFRVGEAFVQLGSKMMSEKKPDKVNGIEVGRTFAKLHVLHSTGYGAGSYPGKPPRENDPRFIPDDTPVAAYRVRYEDGKTETFPVVYGKDVRDWWCDDNSPDVSRGKTAWKGENEFAKQFGQQVRLFAGTWVNPRPDKPVAGVDYVKDGDTPAAPFCVAITLER